VSLLRIDENCQNIRKQSAGIVHIQGAEEEIGIQKATRALEVVIQESEIGDVIVPAQVDRTPRIAQEEKLDPPPERNREVPPAVHNQIN